MPPKLKLYGFGTTRSARCRWTLLESGLPFEYEDDRKLIRSERLRTMQPLGKLPALEVDGEALFESAAICTYIADLAPQAGLVGQPGSRERALHDQWTAFVLTELEAWLWSNFKHTLSYPQEERVADIVEPNRREARKALEVFDDVLGRQPYLTGDSFQVTDIIASWTINWGRRMALNEGLQNVSAYLERLTRREHCTLNPD